MLGVLLDGAREGQRYPAPAEAANLIRSALWMRLARGAPGAADPLWTVALATIGVLGPLVLVAYFAGRRVTSYLQDSLLYPADAVPLYALGPWLEPLAWLVVAVLAATRWRIVAATVAWTGVLLEAVPLGLRYPDEPVSVVERLPLLGVAVTVAAALSVAAARHDSARVSRLPTVLFAVSIVVAGFAPTLDPLTTRVGHIGESTTVDLWPGGGGYFPGLFPDSPTRTAGLARLLAYALALVIGLVAMRLADGGVRRRLFVLTAPAIALSAVITFGFGGFVASSRRFDPPVLLVPEQWVVLMVVPILTLFVGVAWVRRRERRLHLIRLGELAERQPPATATATE
jgi:hypothetical protein